jgi:GPH family glycoside/pentoside/hexuronide:cation symporter
MKMSENENVQSAGPKPLTMKTKLLYGFGDFCFATMSSVESFFFNFFLTNIAEFGMGIVTTIAMITSMVDAALSWIYGGIINAVKPGKFGRYRTWLITLPWIVPFLYAFEFLKIGDGPTAYVLVTLGFIVSHIVWNIPWVANVTLISACGGTPAGRAIMSSSRATWNHISGITFSYIGLPLATFLGPIIGEHNRFGGLAFVTGWMMVLGYFVNFLATSGMEVIETGETAKKKSATKASVGDMAKSLFQNSHLVCLMLADIPRWILRFVSMATIAYYFTYVAQNMALMPIYMLIAHGFGNVGGALLSGVLAKKLSGRNALITCYSVMITGLLLVYFNYASPWAVIIIMCIVNLGTGFCSAAAIACYADTAVYAQWKTGADARGWIMGLNTLPLKIGVIGRAAIINASLAAIGFNAAAIRANPELLTVQLQKGITSAFTLIPCIFLVVGLLLLIFGYGLSGAKIVQYQKEIAERAKA